MFIFLFCLFPVTLLFTGYNFYKSEHGIELLCQNIPAALLGAVSSGVICAVYAFFIFSSPYTKNSLMGYSLCQWFIMFFPFAIVVTFYMFWANDSLEKRIKGLIPLSLSYFSVYLPYISLKQDFTDSFYICLVRPVLILLYIYIAVLLAGNFYRCVIEKNKKFILEGFLLILFSLLPFFIQGIWYFGLNFVFWFIPAVAYGVFCGWILKVPVKEMLTVLKSGN